MNRKIPGTEWGTEQAASCGLSLGQRAFSVALLAMGLTVVAHAADMRVSPGTARCVSKPEKHLYCTLQQAIQAANRSAEADVIHLEHGAVYRLNQVDHVNEGGNGLPAITGALTIDGNGAVIERSSEPGTPLFRTLRVEANGDLALRNVTLRNGATARGFDGAAIWNLGKLTIESSVLEQNHSGDDGGAIRSDGILRMSDSIVRGNSAKERGGVGGGLQTHTQFGTADTVIERTRFEDNEAWSSGGGLWLLGSTVLINATVSGNRAGERGGAVMNYGTLEVRDSTITENQSSLSAGGLFTYSEASLRNTVLTGNQVKLVSGFPAVLADDCEGKLLLQGQNRVGRSDHCVIEGN